MNETVKYMTVEECKLYRELAAKQEGSMLKMATSLPCCEPFSKVEDLSKRKAKREPKKSTAIGLD
ncbi:MAG: hypothetical protein KKF43_17800 [Proteobacteria bacterium]|nr:hypothetical protein [Pseudomonadota bacterium]